jgi:hypothetical protein
LANGLFLRLLRLNKNCAQNLINSLWPHMQRPSRTTKVAVHLNNECSIELFIKLAMTLFFKRQQHRKLSWLDKDSDEKQSQFDELFN